MFPEQDSVNSPFIHNWFHNASSSFSRWKDKSDMKLTTSYVWNPQQDGNMLLTCFSSRTREIDVTAAEEIWYHYRGNERRYSSSLNQCKLPQCYMQHLHGFCQEITTCISKWYIGDSSRFDKPTFTNQNGDFRANNCHFSLVLLKPKEVDLFLLKLTHSYRTKLFREILVLLLDISYNRITLNTRD